MTLVKPDADVAIIAIGMREHLERIMDERDRLYDMRFRASEIAVNAALAGQEKAVTAAFLASEKAIVKAEEAQKDYNVHSNGLRGQLDTQAKTFMPRPETAALFKAVDDRITTTHKALDDKLGTTYKALDDKLAIAQANYESRIELLRASFEKGIENLAKEVISLRETRSEASGKSAGALALWGYVVGIGGVGLSIVLHFIK